MALSNQDRVLEKSTTTGVGTYTLAGTPGITGFNTNDYDTFASVGNANTVVYTAVGVDPTTGIPNNTGWEIGLGTYTASGTTLARTTIYRSTNANAAVNWGAGTRFIFCSPLTEGPVVIRQPGGTVGDDQFELSENGVNAVIHLRSSSFPSGFLFFADSGVPTIFLQGVTASFPAMRLSGTSMQFVLGDASDFAPIAALYISFSGTSGIKQVAASVVAPTSGGSTADGWLQNTAGRAILTSNATNATATMANLTGLTINVITGRKYTFKAIVYAVNSTAAEGAKFDFDGGNATVSSFRAHGTLFDTALLLSTQTTSLAGDFAQGLMTGDSMFEVHGSFTASSTGTFIMRFAENSTAVGTLTVYAGSHILVEDMP